jgi:VIT1/CCC1 family predicted Fe2+/Mn2+ transporter
VSAEPTDTTDGKPPYRPHLGDTRPYWRDIILGVNDGLVSMFLLVAGVVGGGLSVDQVLLTGVAGALAGAISMATGEWLATKSQEEVFDREVALEAQHIRWYREQEIEQLREMLGDLGLEGEVLEAAVSQVGGDDDALMESMKRLEFGVVEDGRRSPWKAAVYSGALFIAGAAPSVLPFVFVGTTVAGLWWAAAFAGAGLFGVGVAKTVATGTNPIRAGLENLSVSLLGGILSFGVGRLFDANVG